ncbi:MAG: endonuclease MutS2 [Candidatus Obscuribacterales bacterium]|nr:endonuclease MutS2 [Candidatus Obscuribacterales bacterium]
MEPYLNIERRSLRSLEWDRLLLYLSLEARSAWGKERCLALEGSSDLNVCARLIDETDEALIMITNRSQLIDAEIPDLRETVQAIGAQARLSPADLLDVKDMLVLTKTVKGSLSLLEENSFPRLSKYAQLLHPVEELRKEIERCIDDQGQFKDEASSELRNLRSSVRRLHGDIRNELGRLMHSSTVSKALQEPIYTQRGGRYVLPVDVTKRGTVDGIVHDSSQSGLTVYVEPMSIVEPTNKIRIKEGEIEREIERLIAELSKLAHTHHYAIGASFETLTDLDVIAARARLAFNYKGVKPELSEDDSLVLINASHPLLLLQKVKVVVSNDVRLGGKERTLVITGPNTGGKTVLLKQLGLVALMVRAGLLIPAKLGSKFPIFDRVWADIGDEQSLTQSLSTFSSHMQNIVEVVDNAKERVLILLDEVGVGTDPKEGAALARAVLEHLNKSGAITVTTTHYGELKMLAYSEPGFVNGSLEFDETTLSPTYRLRLGVAGSSKGTAIARRLGLNVDVVQRATDLIQGREEELSQAMSELERRTQVVSDNERSLRAKEQSLERERAEFERESAEAMSEIETKRHEYAGVLESEYHKAMSEIKILTKQLQATPSLKNAQQAREKLANIRRDLGWLEKKSPKRDSAAAPAPITEGQQVNVMSLNQIGVVEKIVLSEGSGAQATVRVGRMRVKVSLAELEPANMNRQARKQAAAKKQRPPDTRSVRPASTERALDAFIRTSTNTLDLRGERVDAALQNLDRFMDQLRVEGVTPAMIIHGHGTGAVRGAVRDYLRNCRFITNFRPGEIYEGGDGVTIVSL